MRLVSSGMCNFHWLMLAPSDETERCGRLAALEMAREVARPHSLQ